MNLQHNKNILETYNYVLNKVMAKEFDWFKRIEIVIHTNHPIGIV